MKLTVDLKIKFTKSQNNNYTIVVKYNKQE